MPDRAQYGFGFNPFAVATAVFLFAGCGDSGPSIETVAVTESRVTAIASNGDEVWAGCEYHWLVRVGTGGGVPEFLLKDSGLEEKDARRRVRWIAIHGNDLVLATDGGVVRYSPSKRRILKTWTSKEGLGHDSVRWVGRGPGGIWAGTIKGVSRLKAGGLRWQNYGQVHGLPGRHVYRMLFHEGKLWASCIGGGLARYDDKRDRWTAIPPEKGLGNKFIYSIMGAKDELWLGTAAGVNLYSIPGSSWNPEVCADGFTDLSVYATALIGDSLWFGTSEGVIVRRMSDATQKTYDSTAGLPHNEVSSMLLTENTLWIGTRKGLARADRL